MHSNKQKTEIVYDHPRRKLYSLSSLTTHEHPYGTISMNKNPFEKLERSLNRDNYLEEQPVAEPVAIIPGFEEEVAEGKLWNYFAGKMEEVSSKVEKEKVNCREKQFWIIKQQISNLQNAYSKQVAQIEAVIRDKYKHVHALFEQIKQERSLKPISVVLKPKKSKKEMFSLDNTEKLIALKEQVQLIRNDVLQFQQQLSKVTQDSSKLKREWLTFIKSILKGGYYLKQGMTLVLKQMINEGYTPSLDDMPELLDDTSKRCLLEEYNSLKTARKLAENTTPHRFERSRIYSQAKQSLGDIARKDLVREVYKDTKQFMANLVKQSGWKTESITLPKIQISRKEEGSNWRDNQRKRLSYAYNGQSLIKAKGILFGWKVPSLQ